MSKDTKFKVGEKVKVKQDLIVGNRYYMGCKIEKDSFVDSMEILKGEIVTIESVDVFGYSVEEDKGKWNWTDEMLEDEKVEE